MKSRQSHKPRGRKSNGSLRSAVGKRTSTVGQTSRQAKQFASGIMGKYGWDRNNYLGMFALIFKGKGLLTDKELASIQNPSDRAWILQLQLQLQNLKHPESAPLITKQQTIQQIEKLVTQSGYQIPKQVLVDESQKEVSRVSSEHTTAAVDVPVKKKRGRKAKKNKELAAQVLAEQEMIYAAKHNLTQSKQETINNVNKRNSPIMQRSMRQLVASIGMLAHSTSSKMNQPSPTVNGVQHTGRTTNISQKTVNLLFKQALRDNKNTSVVRSIEQEGQTRARANHSNVAQHVDAIQNASLWLEQFQSGKLSLGRNDDAAVSVRFSEQSKLPSNPSVFNVAKLILQEITHTPMSHNHRGLPQLSSSIMNDHEVPRARFTDLQAFEKSMPMKLGEGPFSGKPSPSTVRFIRSLLSKHAEGQDVQTDKRQPVDRDQPEGPLRASRNESAIAKGFLSSSLQPMAINAASLTSRLPRSMHASANSSSPSRSRIRGFDASTTTIWRKLGEQPEVAQTQPVSHVLQEQGALTEVVQRLQQERDEIRLQEAASSQLEVIEQLRNQQEQQEVQQRVQREELQEQQESRQRVQREELQEQQESRQRVQREELQGQHEAQQWVQRAELQDQQVMQQRLQSEEPQETEQASSSAHEPERQSQRLGRDNSHELFETQVTQSINENRLQRKLQVDLEQEVHDLQAKQQVEPVEQSKQGQQRQDEDAAEFVIVQQFEQPGKRKRGRPRKPSGDLQTRKETTKEIIVGSPESAPIIADVQLLENTTSDAETESTPEQPQTASKHVDVVTAHPSQVFRKPALMENRKAKAQKIQSNESWLQQLVTIQRQPSPNNDSFIRSTNSVNQDGKQVRTNRATAQLSVNVVRPDLGTDVLARSASKLRDQRRKESVIVPRNTSRTINGEEQRRSTRLHRQQENRSVDSNILPIQQELGVSHSKTQSVQEDKTRNGLIKQEDQLLSNSFGVSEKSPTAKLTPENAARIAGASVRSIGTLLPSTSIEQRSTMNREVVRLLRYTLRSPGVGPSNNKSTVQQQPGVPENQARLGPQVMALRHTLAAETAAKVAESSMAFVNSGKVAGDGSQLLQRSLRQSASLIQKVRSLVSTEADRENGAHSAAGTSEIQTSVREQSLDKVASEITNVGFVQPASRTPLNMVRRDESPTRVDQVREQQARIQRRIDLGQFISRKPTLSPRTDSILTNSDNDTTRSSSTGARVRDQLTLRAGRIENGMIPRRGVGSKDAPPLETPSMAEQGSVQPVADVERKDERQHDSAVSDVETSEPVTGDVGVRTSLIRENFSSSSRMDTVIDGQNSEAATLGQLSRLDREVDSQLGQPAREIVRGEIVQRPFFVEHSRSSNPSNRNEHAIQARSIGNGVLGTLVQRSLGITSGLRVRRADQSDTNQSRSASGEWIRSNLVQRSSEDGIRDKARQVVIGEKEGRIDRRVDSEPVRSAKRASAGTTSSSLTKRAVDLTNRKILGQRTLEASIGLQGTEAAAGHLIQRASETRIRQLIQQVSAPDIRQGLLQRGDGGASSKREAMKWSGAQAEHLQRRIVVDGSERAPMQEVHGSENRLEAERFQTDSAEQTIRAMVSAQVEEQRAQGLEPAAASRAAEPVSTARAARAPKARQSTSMTPRVMPLLASSAGALRAAPAGMAAASPAAAEHRLPARGMGSLVQAAAAGGAAAATAGALSGASITNSSSQGWSAALTKPLPTQVQRLARPVDATRGGADSMQGTPAQSVPMQSRSQQLSIGASHQSTPTLSVLQQSRTQQPSIGASHQGTPTLSVLQQSRSQQPSIGASHQGTPALSVPMQSRTQQPSIGASHQGTPMLSVPMQTASQEHLASPLSMLEHKQAPTSQLANAPLDMDWLRTKTSADSEPAPAAPVDLAPPELSEGQLQELIKQLPQLDISKIADKVYREIEKKMKFERQRRGI
ncbi:hypothetical protein [Paenibacillus oryzisoli]|uniref:Uncharacterized protein n=1 Tax=Paenibacillus oryzisoli TaxID=1850517 RepID=A0A198ABN8_9BACL|nr:hypothetical protein [Paenibacillus oryzisoli]OAS18510.1 hypothetical protein A8708_03825 [Paenibacillus oryzisoli]